MATAIALPPELPPEIRQLLKFTSVFTFPLSSDSTGDPQTFLVGPNNELTVPELLLFFKF